MPATAIRQRRNLRMKKLEFREGNNAAGDRVGIFEGYLAAYGNRDSYDSSLQRGVFAKSLAERDSFPLLADHDETEVIGSFTATEDDHGLRIKGEILLDVRKGNDKWLALKSGAIDGLSVGFSCIREEWDATLKLLKIFEAKLWEGSVVTFQANPEAYVDQLRSIADPAMRKAWESVLQLEEILGDLARLSAKTATGDKNAVDRVLTTIDEIEVRFEALRSTLEAAADPETTPPEGHLAATEEQRAEIDGMLDRIKNAFPQAAAAA